MSARKEKIPGRKPWEVGGFWNDETIAKLKRLWADGFSASQISTEFKGVVTRNAVIGKAARLGLVRSTAARKASLSLANVNTGVRKQFKAAPKAAPAPKAAAAPSKPRLTIASNGAVYETADSAPTLPPVKAAVWAPLPGSDPVTIMGLGPRSCRWPIDLLDATELHFCGLRAIEGPYCGRHAELSAPRAGSKERLDLKLGVNPRRDAA